MGDVMQNEVILAVRDLSVRYGGVLALSSVSFDVPAGSVVGLIGPNGAGKTTCIDALSGFTAPSRTDRAAPQIVFRNASLDGCSAHERARRGFARTFQSLELFDDLTVRENLLVAVSTPTLWSTLTDALWPKRHVASEIDETLALVGLSELAAERPRDLSNGQRHLVAVARALVSGPSLLLLDEPAAGLDPAETVALGALLRSLPARGVSVLLVDHDMSLVLSSCDQIHVLDFGSIIASGTSEQIRNDPLVIAAYLGHAASGQES